MKPTGSGNYVGENRNGYVWNGFGWDSAGSIFNTQPSQTLNVPNPVEQNPYIANPITTAPISSYYNPEGSNNFTAPTVETVNPNVVNFRNRFETDLPGDDPYQNDYSGVPGPYPLPTYQDDGRYEAQLAAFDQQTDDYINQLIDQSKGDMDLAIRILTRDHDVAIGSNDEQTAQFLEKVSDSLEQKIGRIPYDYETASRRIGENLSRVEDVTKRNTDLALSRLAEDEQVWKQNFGRQADDVRQTERESLSQRGLVSGTREQAQGLAGREVGQTETDIRDTLSAYDRALARQRDDVNTSAEDTLFDARREAERLGQDAKTEARRGVIDTQDTFKFGTEAERRRFEARQKELERQRTIEKSYNPLRANIG